MVDTGILCSNGHVVRRAGSGVNATAISESYTNDFIKQAEAAINSQTRYDWSSAWASISGGNVAGVLTDAAASWAAMLAINYDMSGYPSRIHAETMLDVLRDRFVNAMKLLEDEKVRNFVGKP